MRKNSVKDWKRGKNREKKSRKRGKEKNSERKGKNWEGSFTLSLLTNKAVYATTITSFEIPSFSVLRLVKGIAVYAYVLQKNAHSLRNQSIMNNLNFKKIKEVLR